MLAAALAAVEATFIEPRDFHYCGLTVPIQRHPRNAIQRLSHKYNDFELLQVQTVIRHGAPMEATAAECPILSDTFWRCDQTVLDVPHRNRHGKQAKHPARLFDNVFDMPLANINMGTCENGQLLNWGMEQHKKTGEAMHYAYTSRSTVHDPNHRLDSKDVWLYSDNFDRTEASGKLLFSHMFPRKEWDRSTHVSRWHQADKSFYALAPWCTSEKCLNSTKVSAAGWYKLSWEDPDREITWCWWQAACNYIPIDADLNTLKETTRNVTVSNNEFLSAYLDVNSTVTNGAVVVPELVNLVRHNMHIAHKNGTIKHNRRFVLFSAHDTTLMPLMAHLQIPSDKWVPFASVFNMELWKAPNGKQFVRVLYQGKPVRIPFCKGSDPLMCPFEQFYKYLHQSVKEMKDMGMDLPDF